MNMFPDTITLYNRYVDGGMEKWQRTVLTGVYWNAVKGAVLRRTGAESADSVVILIPKRTGYQKPIAWQSERKGWTLQPGDTVVKGEITVEISRSISKELNMDDVLTITNVDDKDFGGGMAHWEVSGR